MAVGVVAAPILRDVLERLMVDWYSAYVLLPSRMDGLMYGIAVALIVRNKHAFSLASRYRGALDALAIFCFVLTVTNYTYPFWPGTGIPPLKQSALSITWTIIILRIFTCPQSRFNRIWHASLLAKIGLISYGLYMYHQTINGLVHGLLFNQEPTIATPVQLFASLSVVAISVGLAALSYKYFEVPIRRYGAALVKKLDAREEVSTPARSRDGLKSDIVR